jgi:GH24 family phage-related lysozyme (muramidase)
MPAKDYVWGVKGINRIANKYKLTPLKIKQIIKEETEKVLLVEIDYNYFARLFCQNKKGIMEALKDTENLDINDFHSAIKRNFRGSKWIIKFFGYIERVTGISVEEEVSKKGMRRTVEWAIVKQLLRGLASRCRRLRMKKKKQSALPTKTCRTGYYWSIERGDCVPIEAHDWQVLDEKEKLFSKPYKGRKGFRSLSYNEELIDFIKKEEGFRPVPYDDRCPHTPRKDCGGTPTIGYGTTSYDEQANKKVTLKDRVINKARANELLRMHASFVMKGMNKYLKEPKLNQNQINALVSVGYNTGRKGLLDSNLFTVASRKPNDKRIPDLFRRLISAPGHKHRREREIELYFTPTPQEKSWVSKSTLVPSAAGLGPPKTTTIASAGPRGTRANRERDERRRPAQKKWLAAFGSQGPDEQAIADFWLNWMKPGWSWDLWVKAPDKLKNKMRELTHRHFKPEPRWEGMHWWLGHVMLHKDACPSAVCKEAACAALEGEIAAVPGIAAWARQTCGRKKLQEKKAKKKKAKVSKVGQRRVSKKIGILISKEKMAPKQAAAVAYSMEKRGELKERKKSR